jgi:amino acid transporter
MGIFAFIAPLISTYIIVRLLSRKNTAWLFVIINIIVISIIPFIFGLFFRLSSILDIAILMIIYSLIFVPVTTYILRSRRKRLNFQGKWNILTAFRKHWVIYAASMVFYAFSLVFIWSFAFDVPSSLTNLIFYVFTGFLTFYYLILGFGIARVGMEEKRKRKREMEQNREIQ